ncbi:MAG: hypothetical protein RI893_1283 [Pseudomonadota bacterium]|jgi:diguanylate cyclase (GGDEF)-like protein
MITPSQQPMILIVDDVLSNVQILAEALSVDYRIKVASNGEDALKIAQREPPDLILLDVMMPHMNGFEVCRRLKENTDTRNIAVVFVTAMSNGADEEKGLNLGAVDYITKPFMIPITKARIRNHISLKLQADLLGSLAFLDALTLIPNRRRFDETLISEWGRALRDTTPLSMAIINIDYFQKYNNYYGYGAGDVCLKMLAGGLVKRLNRPGDFIARYADDEFMVLLPDTHLDAARQITERLRMGIEMMGLEHYHPKAHAVVTISIGVATQSTVSKNIFPKVLSDAALDALYLAKKGGRNQVCHY